MNDPQFHHDSNPQRFNDYDTSDVETIRPNRRDAGSVFELRSETIPEDGGDYQDGEEAYIESDPDNRWHEGGSLQGGSFAGGEAFSSAHTGGMHRHNQPFEYDEDRPAESRMAKMSLASALAINDFLVSNVPTDNKRHFLLTSIDAILHRTKARWALNGKGYGTIGSRLSRHLVASETSSHVYPL